MQQYFGISAMVVICSLLGTIVYIGIRKQDKRYSFYVFFGFFGSLFLYDFCNEVLFGISK